MKFVFEKTEIPEVVLVTHERAGDERGFFAEVFRDEEFREAGLPGGAAFLQENHSRSTLGVLRGLHYQLAPKAQGKLVRCPRGAILDVALDLRRASPTFGRWVARELSEDNRALLWIPPGFAHGFYTLSELADVVYKQTDYYSPEHERGIRFDDPKPGIRWPEGERLLAAKDLAYPPFDQADTF